MQFCMQPQGQPLTVYDTGRRFDFATYVKTSIAHKKIDIDDILFTDECLIGIGASSLPLLI